MSNVKSWREVLTAPTTSIREAIQKIDSSSLQIALVVDAEQRLLGTVTDGDVRRGILKGIGLDATVERVMNPKPIVARHNDANSTILAMMKARRIHHIPVVDDEHRLINVEILDDLIVGHRRPNAVMLMAGGLGARLRPLTDNCPKPLLQVGNKPLLETILENFIDHGFRRFYISVNYKAEMIEDYFGDGSRWDSEISYVRETEKMGTAGALGLLDEKPTQTMLVMNGDLLTKVNFAQLLDFHEEHAAQATMCVREYDFQVPYGVVDVEGHAVTALLEKPVHKFFVNAGIYALHPEAIAQIPRGQYLDMTTLFEKLISQQKCVCSFPIREYWMDIGHLADFERANAEYTGSVFLTLSPASTLNAMHVLIVGYGSIGARHARVLHELGCTVSIVSRREIDLSDSGIAQRFAALPEALNAQNFDYIVIANRTSEHYETMKVLAEKKFSGRILVEKPLFDKMQTPPVSASTLGRTLVAYNLRFSPVMLRVRELLRGQKLISAQARVGQWLPSWRPNSDYRDSYSAHKAKGGGALRDLSHELDYLNWLFGGWLRVAALGGKFSSLEIDSDDVFAFLLETNKCPVVSLEVNYLDRVTRRELIINTHEETIRVDFMAGEIQINERIEKFAMQRDETYRAQHRAIIHGESDSLFREIVCSLEEGLEVLRLIEASEIAAAQERWVRREEIIEMENL